eukprot:m.12096 g.12096  ORF g.12096 m.12096 type:complete len:217 (+) comp6079_c0_seq1:582-1232(+)
MALLLLVLRLVLSVMARQQKMLLLVLMQLLETVEIEVTQLLTRRKSRRKYTLQVFAQVLPAITNRSMKSFQLLQSLTAIITLFTADRLRPGQMFASKAELVQRIKEFEESSWRALKSVQSNQTRYEVKCSTESCGFFVRAFKSKDGPFTITSAGQQHAGCSPSPRLMVMQLLRRLQGEGVDVREMSAAQLKEAFQQQYPDCEVPSSKCLLNWRKAF